MAARLLCGPGGRFGFQRRGLVYVGCMILFLKFLLAVAAGFVMMALL
jgi:hypothetical protein